MCPGWSRTLSFLLLFQPQTRASLSPLHFHKRDRILSAVLAKKRGSPFFLSLFLFSSLRNPFYFISKNEYRNLSVLQMSSYLPSLSHLPLRSGESSRWQKPRARAPLSPCVTPRTARGARHTHAQALFDVGGPRTHRHGLGHRDSEDVATSMTRRSVSHLYRLPLSRLLEGGPFHAGQFLYKSISYFYVITMISVHILKRRIHHPVFDMQIGTRCCHIFFAVQA